MPTGHGWSEQGRAAHGAAPDFYFIFFKSDGLQSQATSSLAQAKALQGLLALPSPFQKMGS